MHLPLLMLLSSAACLQAGPIRWPWSRTPEQQQEKEQAKNDDRFFRLPWTSRTREQQRLNAATAPRQTSREEQVMKPDLTRQFDLNSANFGGKTLTGKKSETSAFTFVNKTRVKTFETETFATKEAPGSDAAYATKSAPTKESWFARMTAPTKTYATRESREANKGLQGAVLPGSDQKFVAIGRRQSQLDKNGAAGMPQGGDRDSGQSWSGELKPMSIQDVKDLLNKN